MRRLIWFWQAASIGEPLTPVICHSVVTAAGSPLSLSSLILSLCHFSEVILTASKQNKTTVPTNSLSLLLVLSLSLSVSLSVSLFLFLSLWSDSKSHWTTTPCSQALGASTSSITFPLCHKGLPRILSYCVLQVTKQITASKNPSSSKQT